MNNEEKILESIAAMQSILTTIQADIASLKEGQATLTAKFDRMDVRQDAMKEDIKDLKAGQAAIAHDIKEVSEQTRDLVEFEAETRLNFDKASRKLDSFQRVTAQNTFNIAELQTRAI